MCHHVFMYDNGRDENNNSQTNTSIKYISNTYRRAMPDAKQNQMKSIATR